MSAASTAYSDRPSAIAARTCRSISTLSSSRGSIRAAVTTGGQCPGRDGGWAPLGAAAILVCEETAIHDSIKLGLAAAGADCARVGLLGDLPDGQGGKRPFDLANDLALL